MAKSKARINWVVVKEAYIGTKELSLRMVAKKYKISYGQVQRVSKQEGWVQEKDKRWEQASEDAMDKIQDSMSELIVRHAKVGRFFQTVGIKGIRSKFEELVGVKAGKKRRRGLRDFEDKDLIAMVKAGAGIERAAFPKQLDVRADIRFSSKGLSKAEDKAMYEVFRKNITKRKPARKRGRGKA